MKIIIVPNEPNPNMTGRHYGIAKALASRGHEVHTLMWDLPHQMNRRDLIKHLFTSWRSKDYSYEDLHMHKVGRLPLFWPYVNGWWLQSQLKRLYRRLGADIVIAQSFTNETSIPSSLPFIYDLADDYYAPADVFGSKLYKLAFKLLGVRHIMAQQTRRAGAVTAVSQVLVNYATRYNPRVNLLPNGVEGDIITKALAAPASKKINRYSMIYVSGFGRWSQPTKLMQAVLKLHKHYPKISLTLVGEGSEVPAIKAFIADNNAADFIKYHGFVHDRSEVFTLISGHAIGLNISEKNAWRDAAHPMKVVEYSALGKKVVSTNLIGVEALHLPNVFLFANDSDGRSIKRAITQAFKQPTQTYPRVSKMILEQYSWDRIIDQLEQLMTDVTQSHVALPIIHVTPSYPPALGGLEKVVSVLATTQAASGQQVSVITARPQQGRDDFIDTVPVTRHKSFVVANTTIIPALLPHLLKTPKTTIIHLHITQAFTPEMVWLAAKIKGFRYIAHIHLDVPASGMAGFLLKIYKPALLRRVLHGAAYVVVFTDDQRMDISRRYGLPHSRVKVIPNGVEDSYFYDQPRKLHTKPRLLFVGRLGYQKNLGQLLRALAGISEKFETTLVGNGESEHELRQLTKKLKLKNVVFAGRADGDKLHDFYKQADVFVLPSEREGMPLVLLEAMAMGLPSVVTDVTGSRDVIINGQNGLLVPYGDAVALQVALQKLGNDPKLYQQLYTTARTMANDYSWASVAHRFDSLYKETV